jgi:hypothetical protein
MRLAGLVVASLLAFALSACATRPPAPERAVEDRAFVLERDLLGETEAVGAFRAITGQKRAFTARLNGRVEGDVFVLVEDFVFEDGKTDRKTWRLRRVGEGRYEGAREDVVGVAKGFQDGHVFRLEYRMRLGSRVVKFRDVIALGPDGAVLNDATVGLWGVRVGAVNLVMRRP